MGDRAGGSRGWTAPDSHYATLLEGMGLILVRFDRSNGPTYASPRLQVLTGWPTDSEHGVHLEGAGHADSEAVERLSGARARAETEPQNATFCLRHADGAAIEVHARQVPIRSQDGRVLGYDLLLSASRDKSSDTALKASNELREMNRVASGVAHQFNNLLTGVMGNAMMASRAVLPAGERQLQQIETGAQRAAELNRQLQFFLNDRRDDSSHLEISGFVEELRPLLRAIVRRQLLLRTSLAPDLPRVEAPIAALRHLVISLVLDAVDTLGDWAGTITVSTGTEPAARGPSAWSRANPDVVPGGRAYLDVAYSRADETGLNPIPAPTDARPTRSRSHEERTAALRPHLLAVGARLRFTNDHGEGASARCYLPAATASVQNVPVPLDPTVAVDDSTGYVLVVDDEETVRTLVRRILETDGIPVVTAASGNSALELYERHGGSLRAVLLDMRMPGMDGVETCKELLERCPSLRVVLSSGYRPEPEWEELTEAYEQVIFLPKPYTRATLRETMRRMLA